MTGIRLYNTRTRTKEPFRPLDPENVRMYVCGPTVYDRAHIGNARPVIVFDVLFRLLRHVYGPEHVTYVRNFTDVDDKINARAAELKAAGDARPLVEIIRTLTDETIGWYHADMGALGTLPPTKEPRATDYIARMVAMIERLIASGHAYARDGHVLFRVRSYKDYGQLSGRSVDDMIAGARVEVAPFKEDPMDFVLWKPSGDDLPGWDSPWGRGRPGWHIECSAMSEELLGPTFDIHGGGIDLQFPHHENEIAQSMCAHPDGGFARVWMHNEMLQVEGKKMSKSLGNFFTVRDLLEDYSNEFAIANIGPAIRLRLLEAHYRSPIDAGKSHIEAAAVKLGTWAFWLVRFKDLKASEDECRQILEGTPILDALCDDLNTSLALKLIGDLVEVVRGVPPNGSIINSFADNQEGAAKLALAALRLLGFDLSEMDELQHSNWSARLKFRATSTRPGLHVFIDQLLVERDRARSRKDFARSDAIRAIFDEAGVIVRDTPRGPEWELSADFDPAKLEALK